MKIPHRYSHYVFGILQSGITCAVASGISVLGSTTSTSKIMDWLMAWSLSWATMLPVVFLIAPVLRHAVERITEK
jgi:hypothetical protein